MSLNKHITHAYYHHHYYFILNLKQGSDELHCLHTLIFLQVLMFVSLNDFISPFLPDFYSLIVSYTPTSYRFSISSSIFLFLWSFCFISFPKVIFHFALKLSHSLWFNKSCDVFYIFCSFFDSLVSFPYFSPKYLFFSPFFLIISLSLSYKAYSLHVFIIIMQMTILCRLTFLVPLNHITLNFVALISIKFGMHSLFNFQAHKHFDYF